jgi:hypothetical protein
MTGSHRDNAETTRAAGDGDPVLTDFLPSLDLPGFAKSCGTRAYFGNRCRPEMDRNTGIRTPLVKCTALLGGRQVDVKQYIHPDRYLAFDLRLGGKGGAFIDLGQ